MSNPPTHVVTAVANATRIHQGLLHPPATARYPPTGAMPNPAPSTRWDQRVNRFVKLYPSTQRTASGESARHNGLSAAAAMRNTPIETTTETHASRTVSTPRGS